MASGLNKKELEDENEIRNFKFQVWHNKKFLNKDMNQICNDIIENYQDYKFKVDNLKLNFSQEEKSIL